MTDIPTRLELDQEDADTLNDLRNKQQAIMDYAALVSEQGDQKIQKLQEETRSFWTRMASKYNIDVEHVNYTLSQDGKGIVPMNMRFNPQ